MEIKPLTPNFSDSPLKEFVGLVKTYAQLDRKSKRRKDIMKRIKELFTNSVDFEVFRVVPLNKKTFIFHNDEYCLIVYEKKVPSSRSWWREDDYMIVYQVVLVGVNDDGKLFANYLDPSVYGLDPDWDWVFKHIKTMLSYDEDYDGDYVFIREGHKNFRVQGDLVFAVRPIHIDLVRGLYRDRLIAELSARLCNSVVNFFADKVLKYFSDMRLSVSRIEVNLGGVRYRIRVNKLTFEDRERIKRRLEAYLEHVVNDVLDLYSDKLRFIKLSEGSAYYDRKFYVSFESEFGVGFEECVIEIRFDRVEVEKRVYEFVKEYYRDLVDEVVDGLDFVDYVYVRGNHIVKCRSLPHRVEVRFRNYITGNFDTVVVEIDRNRLYVKDNVLIEHDEHKPVVFRVLPFDDYIYEIDVRNTNIGDRDQLIRNKIILKRLAK